MRMAKIKSSTLLRRALAKMHSRDIRSMDLRYTCNAMASVLGETHNRYLADRPEARKAMAYVKLFAPTKSPTAGDFGWFGNPDDYTLGHNHTGVSARQAARLTAVAFAIAVAEAAGD